MELLLEFIIEFIFEGLVEGALDGMESKKVPMPLRILATVVLFALLIAVGVVFVFLWMTNDNLAFRILLGVVFVGLLGGLSWKVGKVFKKRRQE